MSKQYCYKSALACYMNELIEIKRSCGQQIRHYQDIFTEIDRFFCSKELDQPIITSDIIEEWRKSRLNDRPATLYVKYSVWALLARYISRQGIACYIPKLPHFSKGKSGFTPYIFTEEQINKIFEKSDKLLLKNITTRSALICIPAILRLLYSTGLRISEALSIKNEDIQFERRIIQIKDTKNGSDRIVYIEDSLYDVLTQFKSYRDKMPLKEIKHPDYWFFIRSDGGACTDKAVTWWFNILLEQCNIPYIGDHYGPRVHDIRHTFAVHSFMNMTRAGIELYASLPIVSTCLGHKSLSATEKYVRLTSEMYPDILSNCSGLTTSIYPQTSFNNEY